MVTNEFEIKNLLKSYNKVCVVDIPEMHFQSGQFIALMGKNGSGKSTLMRLLAQQELFNSGEILFRKESLKNTSLSINDKLAFISEDHELPFAVEITYWIEIYKRLYPAFNEGLLNQLSRSFEIDLKKSFHNLSRGQKMKALFCLQAAKQPDIYLLDEITSVLDAGSRWELMQFLKIECSRGCLIVMSTNIASEMQGFATDVVFLDQGKINFASTCNHLKESFKKIRVHRDVELPDNFIKKFKRISLNNDGSWTYLGPLTVEVQGMLDSLTEDMREISISDVQAYLTSVGGRN